MLARARTLLLRASPEELGGVAPATATAPAAAAAGSSPSDCIAESSSPTPDMAKMRSESLPTDSVSCSLKLPLSLPDGWRVSEDRGEAAPCPPAKCATRGDCSGCVELRAKRNELPPAPATVDEESNKGAGT